MYNISHQKLNQICFFNTDRKPMVQLETMPMILQFFAEVCSEGLMRDWLGSPEGSVFWPFLLTMLCNKPVDNTR